MGGCPSQADWLVPKPGGVAPTSASDGHPPTARPTEFRTPVRPQQTVTLASRVSAPPGSHRDGIPRVQEVPPHASAGTQVPARRDRTWQRLPTTAPAPQRVGT